MRRVQLSPRDITAFGSRGVWMVSPGRVPEPVPGFAVELATYAAGADGVRVPPAAGDAVLWEPGELHGSGSDGGMVAVVVECPVSPVAAEG